MKRTLCSLLVATLPFGSVLADAPKSKNAKVTLVYQHELPNVPGKSIKGVLVEYGPGGYSPGHTHPKSAFIYATVLEGAIRSQVNDGPVTTYKAGQSFSELPGDRHGVSANASETKPAKLLAVFVVDTNETELTIPFGNCGLRGTPMDLTRWRELRWQALGTPRTHSAENPESPQYAPAFLVGAPREDSAKGIWRRGWTG